MQIAQITKTLILAAGLVTNFFSVQVNANTVNTTNNSDNTVSSNTAKKPNFVWIISEDNSAEYLRLYNLEHGAAMPNVERLAAQGLTFDNAYANAPVCSTARSTLALGAYAPKVGTMHHRAFARAQYQNSIKSIYRLMKESGYFVTNNAKTDFNFTHDPLIEFNENGKKAHWQNRRAGQAFFHIQTFTTTHEFNLMFKAGDVNNKPTQHDPAKVALAAKHPDTALFRYTYARYLDQHLKLDVQIGKVIAELQQAGELDNTFVFYFGDHGGVLPGSKSFANEQGLRIPLVVRIPDNFRHLLHDDLTSGSRVNNMVSFVDMAPTVLDLAGLPSANYQDGQSFLGKQSEQNRDKVFAYADRFGERYDLVRTLRIGKYKYVRNYLPMNPDGLQQNYRFKNLAYQQWRELYKADKLNATQAQFFKAKPVEALYDLSVDPQELNNLATQAEHIKQLTLMRKQVQNQVKNSGDLGFISEAKLDQLQNHDSVKFAASQKAHIAKLVSAADLMLLPFNQARPQLKRILQLGNQDEKYWALVALNYFGQQAKAFTRQVQTLTTNNHFKLVQARAIEFLARVNNSDPVAAFEKLIAQSEHQLEALEIMNIAAVLHDTLGYQFNITPKEEWSSLPDKSDPYYSPKKYQNGSVAARIAYLKTAW
ncbi:hypothetical protein C2869_06490 [Saccharobesus litoralis]|uniref:Sulfatase N-terminal domain-containing protein n=1 Tax=Saccharobesus litoralis TaxID=2172099 RepID=A0A2S0VPU9_9ALTE|nr:sulfatase [Saccharobesus litoralis]AWB66110.1 hypothetical protein C2869_06490 [Saccharobesus litoralis]